MSATDGQLFFDVQQKTDKQHILDNPDTYIGSVEQIDSDMWIISENDEKIVEKNISVTRRQNRAKTKLVDRPWGVLPR